MRGRIDRHRRRLGRGILAASGIVFALFLNQAPAFGQASAEAHDLPSGRTATTISAVGTLLSIPLMFLGRDAAALGAVGILTGPSIGYFYGGCWGRGLFSTGLRTAFSFIMAAILYDNETNAGFSVWLGGMALSAIYDIATVKKAVNKRNQAKLARRKLDVALAPFAVRKGAGGRELISGYNFRTQRAGRHGRASNLHSSGSTMSGGGSFIVLRFLR